MGFWIICLGRASSRHPGTAIPALEAEAKQCGIEIHNLKKLTGDQKEVQEAVKDLDVMVYRLQSIEQMLDKILATKVR